MCHDIWNSIIKECDAENKRKLALINRNMNTMLSQYFNKEYVKLDPDFNIMLYHRLETMNFDPFVLRDHFNLDPGRGFPDHPHRGFEGITYIFQGGMNHKDNLGNESFVKPGGAQRFTAGKGILHSEMPADNETTNGIQLWVNLPKKLKQMSPSYQQINDDMFPVTKIDGGEVKKLVGLSSKKDLQAPLDEVQ